ncbi:uncharacterized protein LOC130590445 [Beta vulgaris subsp. vulgaris]|uniref:uncharacterized protein LOC130590445 n=1 Tax=Beta vulgaris subsp. vulgaris TaxID=3555 RepID=UPI00254914D8|nr:uncharacterized protein LOC130590445 [Beta vulgaris subsp. vulgaris]
MEKREVKKFRNKGLLPAIEDLWNQLFQDGYATGANVVSINIDPSSVKQDERSGGDKNKNNIDEDYEIDTDSIYPSHYPSLDDLDNRLGTLKNQERGFYSHLLMDVTFQVPGFNPSSGYSAESPNVGVCGASNTKDPNQASNHDGGNDNSKKPQKCGKKTTKPDLMKRSGRQSSRSAMLSNQISTMVSSCNRALELMEADTNLPNVANTHGSSKDGSVAQAMAIVSRMATSGCGLLKYSDMWCFLANLIEDAKRELFIHMDDDELRMTWLKYMETKDK